MANNLYRNSMRNINMQEQSVDNSELELTSYIDEGYERCDRCGNRDVLNNKKLCNECNDTWS